MMVKGGKQEARDSNGSVVRCIQVKIKNLMDEHKVVVDVKKHGSEPAMESVSVLDKRPFSYSLCSGTETEEGLCKELQFSLVDNSKLDDVYLLTEVEMKCFTSRRFTRREKDCFMSEGIKQSSWENVLLKLV
ncbi:hypothetical protein Tco_0449187 [Tanacetum coccineum]